MEPYRNFKFELEIEGFTRAGFSKVDGLGDTTEEIQYREGGDNESPRKLSGQSNFDDVTLERGMSKDDDFNSWRKQIFNAMNANGEQGSDEYKRTVVIYLKNKAGTRVAQWTLEKAWPKEQKFPTLDASANEVAISSMVLCHEGYEYKVLA